MAHFVEDQHADHFGDINVEAHPDCVDYIKKQLLRMMPVLAAQQDQNIFSDDVKILIGEFLLGDDTKQSLFAYVSEYVPPRKRKKKQPKKAGHLSNHHHHSSHETKKEHDHDNKDKKDHDHDGEDSDDPHDANSGGADAAPVVLGVKPSEQDFERDEQGRILDANGRVRLALHLTVGAPPGKERYSQKMRPGLRPDICYFMKVDAKADISPETIASALIVANIKNGVFPNFLRTMSAAYAPALLTSRAFPDSVSKELGEIVQSSMASLTEHINRMDGRTVLYCPIIPALAGKTIDHPDFPAILNTLITDKDVIQIGQTAMLHWKRQIKEVVSERDSGGDGGGESTGGPLDEIRYWRERASDLANIRDQFERPDIRMIVAIMERTKEEERAFYLQPFLDLAQDNDISTNESMDNLRYLNTLEEPFTALAIATPKDIPALLTPLLRQLHLFLYHSRFYKRDRFFRLLGMVSNEIIARCRNEIDLRDIFAGNVEGPMQALEDSIEAGRAWVSACYKMLVATRERFRRERGEQFEFSDIFSEINSFIKHRCMNLQEVCIGQLQFGYRRQPTQHRSSNTVTQSTNFGEDSSFYTFASSSTNTGTNVLSMSTADTTLTPFAQMGGGDASGGGFQAGSLADMFRGVLPSFGGAKGPEIESQLLDIQRAFKLKMDGLSRLGYDILDIKERDWSDDYHAFKNELDDLTMMMVQIISGAFNLVATVEGGAELLEAGYVLAKRDELHRNVERKKDGVFAIFRDELNFVQAQILKETAVLWMHPPYAGRAAWARNFKMRIEQNYRLLSRLWFLQPEKHESMGLYRTLEKVNIEEFTETQFAKWKESLPAVPLQYLDEFLIQPRRLVGSAAASGEVLEGFAVNFPVELSVLIEESRYWLRMGETVPQGVIDVLLREERLRQYRENVCIVVRAYNNIITSLPSKTRKLFSMRVAFLQSKFANGHQKSTWGSQGVVEYFVKDCRLQTDKVQNLVDRFKQSTSTIKHICQHLGEHTLAIGIEKKRDYTLEEFMDKQVTHQDRVKEKLRLAHSDITNIMKELFDCFRNDYKDSELIRVEWHNFVASIDGQIAAALKQMVKRSLTELYRSLISRDDQEKAGENPLFKLEVIIPADNQQGGGQQARGAEASKPQSKPSMQDLNQRIMAICNEAMDVVSVLPMLDRSLTVAVESEARESLEERKLPWVEYVRPGAAPLLSANTGAAPGSDPNEPQTAAAAAAAAEVGAAAAAAAAASAAAATLQQHDSYADFLNDDGRHRDEPAAGSPHESEMVLLMKQIQVTINEVAAQVKMQLAWRMDNLKSSDDTPTLHMWRSKEDALRRARTGWQLADYVANIDGYKKTERKIAEQQGTYDISFIRLDYAPMKDALRKRCNEWVESFLLLLASQATEELQNIYEYFETNLEKLKRTPKNLAHADEQQRLERTVREELEKKRHEYPKGKEKENASLLFQKFQALELHGPHVLTDDNRKKKNELSDEIASFAVRLDECRKQIEKNMESFKSDLESDIRSFQVACEHLKKDLLENGPYSADMKPEEAFKKIAEYQAKVQARREKEAQLRDDQKIVGLERPEQQDLSEMEAELRLLSKIWELWDRWRRETENWKRLPFKQLNITDMNEIVQARRKETLSLRKELERREVWGKLLQDIDLFKRCLPVIEDLLSPALRDRHWRQLMVQLDEQFDPDAQEFCLDTLLTLRVERHSEFIASLASAAKQELSIEKELGKIKEVWEATELEIVEYHGGSKLAAVDQIQTTLTEDITKLGGFKMSPYVEAFKFSVQTWEGTLSAVGDALDTLLLVQQKWMYLENIFIGGEDIKRKLVEEAKLFDQVNSQWGSIMARLAHDSSILKIARPDVVDISTLLTMNGNLEKIQKQLESFLDEKRRQFPRFYFLSNDDLLDILGNSKEPQRVSAHLKNCFEALHRLELDKSRGQDIVRAMISAQGERVAFPGPIQIGGLPVEQWLTTVETRMKETVKRICIATLDDLQRNVYTFKKPMKRELIQNWLSHEGMALIVATQINWTKETERVLVEYGAMGGVAAGNGRRKINPGYRLYKKWKILLKRYCEIVRVKLPKLTRKKLVDLITIDVHNRDILNLLQARRISSVLDFDWIRQLRFYREAADDHIVVRQTSALINYDYEYLGVSGRLVVTPLTDRAYMTLTTAVQLHLGGLPQGPAGTGKTETVKDLSKGIGKYALVFNCGEGLDVRSLGRMLSGLAQTGAWSCFDEFNRIIPSVLSVVAQQISTILAAVKERKKQFIFEGVDMKLNLNTAIFVTMNPGYAGRSELPDNLKALLRPVSMMTPDFAMIAEITLLSQGFAESQNLSKKVAILYQLMESQLSKQDHYDFSLRNIKAVLVQAGNLMREGFPGTEQQLCLKAMEDMNLPKFVKDDVPLFMGMMSDLFPKIKPESAGLEDLSLAVNEEIDFRSMMRTEHISTKTIHLWDTLNTRHGVMCVGQSASGKTTTWQALAGGLKRLKDKGVEGYEPVRVSLLNPKAITMDELYGSYNVSTREWTDGILSEMMRRECKDESLTLKWICFDGPVDTLWIESMNTVLDDNKMLTLNSGERIGMPPQVSMLFEVQDLSQASPATVSRCGMTFFDSSDLGYQPYLYCWLKNRRNHEIATNAPKPENTIKELQQIINENIAKVLEFRREECTELFPTSDFTAVRNWTTLFDAIASPDADPFLPQCPKLQPQHAGESYIPQIRMLAVFAMIWAFGGTLTEESRRKFDAVLRDVENAIPSNDSAFEYYVDLKANAWRSWDDHPDLQKPFSAPEETPYYRLVVPTVDTIRHRFLVAQLVRARVHTTIVGESGTGKSLIAATVVREQNEKTHLVCQINFSAQTTAKNVQDIIEGKMDRK